MSTAKGLNDHRLTFYFVQLFRKLRSFSRYKGSWCALLKTEIYVPWEITASSWGMHSLNLHVPPVTRSSSLLWSLIVLYWQIICEMSAVLKWTEPRAFTSNVSEGIGWLTATVMPLTKANTVSMYDICACDMWDLDMRKWWTTQPDRLRLSVCFQGRGPGSTQSSQGMRAVVKLLIHFMATRKAPLEKHARLRSALNNWSRLLSRCLHVTQGWWYFFHQKYCHFIKVCVMCLLNYNGLWLRQ